MALLADKELLTGVNPGERAMGYVALRAEGAKVLLKYKANPNLPNSKGPRPLYFAIHTCRSAEMTRLLLQSGADVNAPIQEGGLLALQLAAREGNKDIVEAILAFHPNVNALGVGNSTALDQIRNNPRLSDIAALLRANGALDYLPHWDRIDVSRPSANFSATMFRKETNDWNQFTLLQGLALFYTANHSGGAILPFPDLTQITVVRPTRGGTNLTRIKINLLNDTNGIDVSKDIPLEFGDTVEVPERDHSLGETAWA